MKKFVKLWIVLLCLISNISVFAANKVPEKVITMGPNATEMLVALGLQDKIIGTTLNNHSRGPLEQYKDIYEKLPELAFASASRESVLASGADYIFGIDWEFGENGLNIEELNQYGMEVFVEKAKTIDEVYQEIEVLSKVFAVEEKGAALISQLKEEIASVQAPTETPKKVLVLDSLENGIFTAGGTNFETRLIERAGAINIFDDIKEKEWATVSLEEVLARNPEYIIVHDYDQPSVEDKIAMIKADPILSQLEAVKKERFIILELESVLPGVRMATTITKIAEAIKE
ncbi:MAG: ABC transporter substrate-binding protein [Aerococcaceae bacterium]|nr:ABC transporter substrate-binding protein [Aerococcaceae bacterium]